MSKVKIKLQGKFANKSASVDTREVALTGLNNTFTGEAIVRPGSHKLDWAVQGRPGDNFGVEITGDTDEWSQSNLRIGTNGYGHGRYSFKAR